MTRPSLYWLRSTLIRLNWALLALGALAIVDYWTSKDATFLRAFFAYFAGPFYLLAAGVETSFAWRAARGFEPGEALRLPWLLLALAGASHFVSLLMANVLNQPAYVNPIFVFSGGLPEPVASQIREIGLIYFGRLRFLLIGLAFFLVLRAERRVGLRWVLSTSEIFVLLGTGIWLGIHTATAFAWATQPHTDASLSKFVSWGVDFLLGASLMMAIFIRSSVKPLEPGMIARAWHCYVWGVFLTCAGNAGMWASNYGVIPQPYSDLFWLIWFPQVTLFALGPLWQCQAMRAAAGEWFPELDRKLASATKTG